MRIAAEGRRALVTGAGQGIGRSIALALDMAGAEVVGIDIDTEALAALDNSGVTTARVDVTDARALETLVESSGNFDIAVHVAGGVIGQVGRAVETISPQDWAAIVEVNQSAAFYLARAVVPGMKANGWGRIVRF